MAADQVGSPDNLKSSQEKTREEIDKEMKAYLNPHDRFAQRMKASLPGKEQSDSTQQIMDGFDDDKQQMYSASTQDGKFHFILR